MSIAFKKMTRSLAWLMTASLAVAFMLPSSAAAVEFFPTPFRYQWKSQSGTVEGTATVVRANAGDTVAMSLTITNRSIDSRARVIYGKSTLLPEVAPYQGAHELRLGTSNPHDKAYDWVDPSSFITNPDGAANRLAVYDGVAVNPGGDLTFNFNLKIKSGTANGTYDFYAGVVREFDAWARQVNASGRLLAGEDIFWRVIVGGGAVTPATGGLSISLASGTPVAASVAKGGNANFTKMTLTAAAGATVKITSIYVTRDGLTADSDVENVKILRADSTQVGNTAGGFNANHKAQVFITPALEVTGTMDFFVRAGFLSTATSGLTARLGVAVNTDIVSNATAVTGAPVYGNYMTVVAVTIGTVTVASDGSVTDSTPDVGDTNVITNTFKITAGAVEGIVVDRITVSKAGTAETSDTNNIELWDVTNSKTIATVESWTSDGKASWPTNIVLGKGDNIRLRVQLDIVDGVSLTVNTDIIDGSDALIFAKGDTYGFYITPATSWTAVASPGSNNTGQGDYNQTINSGTLTVSKSASAPPAGNIAVADGQLLNVWDFDVRGESMRVSALSVDADSNGTWASDVTFADFTNARLVDMATGNILAGPVDGAADGTDTESTYEEASFVFTSTFVLPVGVTKVGLKTRVGTDVDDADTIQVAINTTANDTFTVKGLITNNTIAPAGLQSASNKQTVKAGALVARTLGNPPAGNVVVGTTDFTWATFGLDAAASGEDANVTAIEITDTQATGAELTDIINAEIWADLDRNGTYETKVSNTEFPADTGSSPDTYTFTLTQTVKVLKGGSINVILVGDLLSTATADGTASHTLTVAATTGLTANGASTGSPIVNTASGTGSAMLSDDVGTLAVALDSGSPTASIMLAGTTGNTVAKFKFTALDEAFTIETLKLNLADWGSSMAQWDDISKLTIEYPTKTGTGSTYLTPSTTTALFDNLDLYVARNSNAVLTVKADFWNLNTEPADFGTQIEIGIDVNGAGDFKALGASSGTAITGGGTDVTYTTSDAAGANTHVLYKTLVTVTKTTTGLNTALTNGGVNVLYKHTVTADSRGAASLKRMTYSVTITDVTGATADLTSFTIGRATSSGNADLTASAASIMGTNGSAANTTADTDLEASTADLIAEGTTWIHVMFGNTPTTGEENIPAGSTYTYTLGATAGADWSPAEDDSATIEMLGDTTAATDAATYLEDNDANQDDYAIILATGSGTDDAADVEFIWSDLSAISHSAVLYDVSSGTDATPTSSGDWTNGRLINNFPLGSFSLIA